MTAGTISFTHCPLWVQVWGLQFDLFIEEMGQDIRMEMGQVVEVDCKGFAFDQAKFLHIRVKIPLESKRRHSMGCLQI